jgi:hypothetical protein
MASKLQRLCAATAGIITVTVCLAQNRLDRDPSVQEMAQRRDLSRYANGGEFVLRSSNDAIRIRDFIWKHWKAKTRAYLIIKQAGTDTSETRYMFIEPRDNGHWHIVCRDIMRPFPRIEEWPEIVSVESTTNTGDGWGGEYMLIFHSQDGKKIWRH